MFRPAKPKSKQNMNPDEEIKREQEGQPLPQVVTPPAIMRRGTGIQVTTPSVDEKAKVSPTDTTTNYLESKLNAGSGITLTKLNEGGNEQLEVSRDPEADIRVKSEGGVSTDVGYATGNLKVPVQVSGVNRTWQEADVGANVQWVVPSGKIYEVYAYLGGFLELNDLNNRYVIINYFSVPCWFPAYGLGYSAGSIWLFDNIDPVTGAVTYQGGSPYREEGNAYTLLSRASRGWILSGDEGLKCSSAWRVRWRDVTDMGK